jgi:hypothetical protein
MVDCESPYRVEGLDDLERNFCEVTESMDRRETLKHVPSPKFFLLRGEICLGLEKVALSPTTSELVACKC